MEQSYDLFVIGGGINGTGIARDASGRGLHVGLAEMGDLASATSSASTKLFHGGLRYLEYFEVGLVRKALTEREVLLRAMPHISWPMRFVLPYHKDMRFEGTTPTSKLLNITMPWMKGRRPAWLIRLGLFMYDHLGGRKILPATQTMDLTQGPEGAPLQDRFAKAYEYSDCWVQDSRLVVLNARDAEARGADIMVQTKVTSAKRDGDHWVITLQDATGPRQVRAKMLVNAAGPWVGDVIQTKVQIDSRENVRLVRGSHIVVKRLYDHDKCYFFQGTDGRIIFAIPYEDDFTLIGTTDQDHGDLDQSPVCSEAEQAYLCQFASQYFTKPISVDDIVWTYSGVRPLYDDGASSAQAATRDYNLTVDANGPPVLNVFGGKITTYRVLAEAAMDKIGKYLSMTTVAWTAGMHLPGGNFPVDGVEALYQRLLRDYPFLGEVWARRMIKTYGTEAWDLLGDASNPDDLGEDFGATLTEAELRWQRDREFARSAEDAVWRRTKLGLRMDADQITRIEAWFASQSQHETAA